MRQHKHAEKFIEPGRSAQYTIIITQNLYEAIG